MSEYKVIVFFAIILASLNPSDASVTSAIIVKSGAIIATGLISAFKLSGNSVRPAYPGFIVMKIPQFGLHEMYCPMNMNPGTLALNAFKIDNTCIATTDITSIFIRLNSSKQPHDPD